MTAPAILTAALGRRYGRSWALRDLDLEVPVGSIYGLLGANGAGKTTTLRILATLLPASQGRAWIAGHDVFARPGRVRQLLGYMPDSFGVYDDLTVLEYLDFYATAHGVSRAGRHRLLDDLLAIVGLSERRASYVDALSRGMKQRLGIARCLVHDPPILLLDEPAAGLDPLARVEVQALLRELARLGKTIVISSHILPELDRLCTHAGIVDHGRLLAHGSVPELLEEAAAAAPLEIEFADEATAGAATDLLRRQPAVASVEVAGSGLSVQLAGRSGADEELFLALGSAGLAARRFGRRAVSLEDVYFAATNSAGAEVA